MIKSGRRDSCNGFHAGQFLRDSEGQPRMLFKYLTRQVTTVGRDEGGQMAFMMVLTLPVVLIFFTLALDAGIWYFDHRMAQNQADAAALAAVQLLPDTDILEGSPAHKAVIKWLQYNGSNPGQLSSCPESTPAPDFVVRPGLEYSDLGGDGQFDSVRVCVRRQSPGIFSQLVGIPFVNVSAAAMARAPGCTPLDIVLVLDNSASIDNNEHPLLQTAATALVDEFCLDDFYGARVGITRFSGSSAPVHDMSADATSLNAAIDAIDRDGSDLGWGTNIVAGLAGGAAQYPSGPGDRSNAPKQIFFITDGDDTRGNYDADIALASLATGAEVFAIGVGSVRQSTLDAIATDPDEKHSFLVSDFAALIPLVKNLAAAATIGGLIE